VALILRRASVWDGETSDLRNADVVCNGGRITALDPAGSTRPAAEDDVVDVDGGALLPGLIDAHVHLVWSAGQDPAEVVDRDGEQLTVLRAAENARAHLHAGVTTVVDLGSNWDVAIAVARAVDLGHLHGPRVVAAGRTVAMTGGHDPFWVNACDGPDAIIRGVREQAFKGAGIIKTAATGGVYGRAHGEEVGASELTLEELEALTAEAHRRGLKVAAHALGTDGIRNAVQAGIDIIQHGVFLTEEIANTMAERGSVLCPTLAVYRTIAQGDGPAYAVAKAAEVMEAHARSVQVAVQAGVTLIAGTDAGSPGMPHPSLRAELSAMKDAGLRPIDILKSATSRAADALGLSAGRVTIGAPADLILVNGDPLTDPTLATAPWGVIRRQRLIRGLLAQGRTVDVSTAVKQSPTPPGNPLRASPERPAGR